ncbi:MAG: recombination regulator RecX [Clostridium sp.]|nr:recombination regulator RecX [Clostridium sp.]
MSNAKARYSAFDTAVYYLTYKARTEKELRDKLSEKGYSLKEVDAAVDRLDCYGYIDDEGYALSYIRSKKGKMGARLIALKLSQKGISRDIIERKLDMADFDEYSDIKKVLSARYSDLSDLTTRRKAQGYMARRGYAYEDIANAINSLVKEDEFF